MLSNRGRSRTLYYFSSPVSRGVVLLSLGVLPLGYFYVAICD